MSSESSLDSSDEGAPADHPRISVITATFNAIDGLRRTAASLEAQRYRNFEWIVVDGASTDGTRAYIESSCLATRFVSEPDSGIHDAWNKGLAMASGDWIAFLNADDTYHPDTLLQAALVCEEHPDSVVVGRTKLIRNGQIARVYEPRVLSDLRFGVGFSHPSTLMPRSMLQQLGPFRAERIAMDTDLLVRALKRGVAVVPANFCVYMAFGGISTKHPIRAFSDYQRILIAHSAQTASGATWAITLYAVAGWARSLSSLIGLPTLARHTKHLSALIMNLSLRLAFFDPLRRLVLRALGIRVARGSWIAPTATFYRVGHVQVGEGSVINRGCLLDNRDAITIGRNVSIAYGCSLITGGHDVDAPYFDYHSKPIRIGDHAVLFAKAMLMPGSSIGEGSVILANSVVTGDVPPYSIYGGAPARFVRERPKNLEYQISYKFPFSL